MKIKMDKAKVNITLNKMKGATGDNGTLIGENSNFNNPQNSSQETNTTNENASVRGSLEHNNGSVIGLGAVATLATLGFLVLTKKDLAKFAAGTNPNEEYIFINENDCEIHPQQIKNFKVVVKGYDEKYYDFETLLNFSVLEIKEIIFIEVENDTQKIVEIKNAENNWKKINTTKYLNNF